MLIGLSTFVLTVVARIGDVVTAGITITVVLIVASFNPDTAWQQPILRLVETTTYGQEFIVAISGAHRV